MIYLIGKFILDTEKEHLLLESSKENVSKHSRLLQLLAMLAEAYPSILSKNELTQQLWPDDDVTEWALSRQVSQLRMLLSSHDPDTHYIKTVHTRGFKLEIEPKVLEKTVLEKTVIEKTVEHATGFGKWLITGIIICLSLVAFVGYNQLKTPSIIYGEIIPKKNIPLVVNANWSSTQLNTIRYTTEGVHIEPIGPDPLFISTSLRIPAFYQGAIFSINMKVNQEFVDHKGWLRLYYQSTLDGWPGEWDCGVDDSIIKTLNFEYHCRIDENGTYTKILEDEPVNFGIKIHQLQPIGHAIIKSADINIPANISTDKGWRTSNGIAIEYNRGVAYEPKSVADQLVTRIKGPTNIPGSKIAFTIKIDDAYKNPDNTLQFFIIDKTGKWQDCFIDGGSIAANVFTQLCNFQNINDPFILNENENVEIGIRPHGNIIKGKLQIVGVTVLE